jgi:hypothetical protein
VTKSQYPFPPDEFDARRPEGAPVGVHRRPRGRWSSVWPFLLVALVFSGIAVGIVSYLSDDRAPSDPPPAASSQEAAGGEEDGSGAEAPGEDAGEEPSAEPTEAEASEEPAEDLTEEEVAALVAQADLTAPISVENAAGVTGLAGETADLLEGAGFSNVLTANFSGEAPSGSTVRYVGDRAETSAAVAAVLGIPQSNVEQVDSLPQGEVAAIMLGSPG